MDTQLLCQYCWECVHRNDSALCGRAKNSLKKGGSVMARKSPSKNAFVLTLPLQCEAWQRDRLDTIFQVGNDIKNNLIAYEQKQYQNLISRKDWKANQAALSAAYEAEDEELIKANAGMSCFPMLGLRSKSTSIGSTTVGKTGKASLSRSMWRRRFPLPYGPHTRNSCMGMDNRYTSLNGANLPPLPQRPTLPGFAMRMASSSSMGCGFAWSLIGKTPTAINGRQ